MEGTWHLFGVQMEQDQIILNGFVLRLAHMNLILLQETTI